MGTELSGLDPAGLAALEVQLARAVSRESFADFVRAVWPLLEPNGRPFVPNAASDAIIEHLQAVGDGLLRRLLIAVPPGSGKSTLASIAFQPWLWLKRPALRAIHASHSAKLATDLSTKARRLIESDWYRRVSGIELLADQNRLDDFANTRSGRRMAIGVDGSLTGLRGDMAIVDDSLDANDRLSKATREAANDWFDSSLTNRLDGESAPIVVIQQRLHSDDLIGHLVGEGGWEYLCLPLECDSSRRSSTSIGWTDTRADGENLAPELYPPAKVAEARVKGSASFSCIWQQNPIDAEGGLFRREHWRFWKPDGTAPATSRRPSGCSDEPAVPVPSTFERTLVSIDCAFKDGEKNDYVVAVVIGTRGAHRYVTELRRGKLDFVKTCSLVKELAAKHRGATFLVEDTANGPAVVKQLHDRVGNLIAVRPDGGKEARASACQPAVEAGQVFLPDGAGWLDAFVEELAGFPRGKHDDQVDALSQALNYLAGAIDDDYEQKRTAIVKLLLRTKPETLYATGGKAAVLRWLDAKLAARYPWAGPARDSDFRPGEPVEDQPFGSKAARKGPQDWECSPRLIQHKRPRY